MYQGVVATDVNAWRFIFTVSTGYNTIRYSQGSFGPVQHNTGHWLGDEVIALPLNRGQMMACDCSATRVTHNHFRL